MRRILGVAVLCFALVGCGCTAAGCESLLQLEFMNVEFQPGSTYHLDICIEFNCISESVTIDELHPGTGEINLGRAGQITVWANSNDIHVYLLDDEFPESVEVSVTVSDADGAVLADAVSDVQMSRMTPNGPRCDPTCFNGQATI